MANVTMHPLFRLLLLALVCAAVIVQGIDILGDATDATGSRVHTGLYNHVTGYRTSSEREINLKDKPKRLLIGSVAPTCTYNECRGCKYKCRAEQVPVEGNDPINSPYHYRCVCHR